jgi:protein SCO1/2
MTRIQQIALLLLVSLLSSAVFSCRKNDPSQSTTKSGTNATIYLVNGVVKELRLDANRIVIRHEEIPDFMPAMTMPFVLRDSNLLTGLVAGDRVAFELHVAADESWIEKIARTGHAESATETNSPVVTNVPMASFETPLRDYKFTNEFGQPVSFNDLRGTALGVTFFFTRCPLPEYCPRLMKNFVGAAEKLRANPNAPTNWHLLAFTFDPSFDTPAVMNAYAQRYHYDSNHWSFLTGAPERIAELAKASGVYYEPDGVFYNHNFRTLVINSAGQLQMSFPVGGDLSDLLAEEIIKAAAVPLHSNAAP